MWSELRLLLELGVVLTVLRLVLLLLLEQKQRFTLRRQLGEGANATLEIRIKDWKRKTGLSLWINIVGIPMLMFAIILFIAEYN